MRKLALLFAVLATMPLAADDISGRWTGTIEVADTASGTTIHTPVKAEFSQKDTLVSGSIGRTTDEGREAIRNGKVEGKRVSFEVLTPDTTGAMKFSLTAEGDRLEGVMKGAIETGPISGKVLLTRAQVKE
jgi:hypothetical protein